MSDYYDIDKPFSIENWNKLIRDLNEFIEAPPAGCPEIEPLEEVEAPHVWKIEEDVEEVRDKLKEACPDHVFNEELKIWKTGIIDEIEEKIGQWCGCDIEPEVTSCGGHGQNLILAGRSEIICCGNVIEDAPCECGTCHRTTYQGDWYPSVYVSNSAIISDMQPEYISAIQSNGNFIGSINQMMRYATDINKWQAKVDQSAALVDTFIAYYEANCVNAPPPPHAADCPDKLYLIQIYGDSAKYYQKKVDAELIKWNAKYALAMSSLPIANSAAVNFWSLALSLEGRYPDDVNFISECFDTILQGMNWYEWWNPYRDSNIQDVIPLVRVWTENEVKYGAGNGANMMYIYTSPDGSPFATPSISLFNQRFTLTYYEVQVQTRSGLVGSDCEWESPPGFIPIYYLDNDFWIWGLLPEPDLADYGINENKIEVTWPYAKGQNNTAEQDEWYDSFLNWYDENPAYDNRHEKY